MSLSISSKNFNSIYNSAVIIRTPKILYRALPHSSGKMGFIISGRLGPACKRNLFKRRMRYLYSKCFIEQNKKIDIIIVPKTINLEWQEIRDSFKLMSKRAYDI